MPGAEKELYKHLLLGPLAPYKTDAVASCMLQTTDIQVKEVSRGTQLTVAHREVLPQSCAVLIPSQPCHWSSVKRLPQLIGLDAWPSVSDAF